MSIGLAFPSVLDAARHGSHWAWQELFDDLAPALNGYALARGVQDHEDLVSDVFAELARRIGTFHGDEKGFRSWVFVIAHSRIVDHYRRARRTPVVPLPEGFDAASSDADPALLIDRLLEPTLAAALRRLSDAQREALVLRVVVGLTLEETAAVMGRTANTVKQLQHRALQSLRREVPSEAVTK